ncbi:NUDIX hydrolase [Salinispirillum sp. LH 10-3-1]|uniref:Phosphatase NudJ n=1 Tax=Salinispirillum sp. LH 10-3-1 TaxID=2952525 RepID=A0AB38YBH0_9GAMM
MSFHPHVTVAALIKQGERYLMVEEGDRNAAVFNQPAGHIDEGETALQACLRETLEETGWAVTLTHLIGVYVYSAPNGNTYYRFGFAALPVEQRQHTLDSDIIAAHWLTLDEINAFQEAGRLRSPLVMQLINDDLAGQQFPLSLIHEGFHVTQQ